MRAVLAILLSFVSLFALGCDARPAPSPPDASIAQVVRAQTLAASKPAAKKPVLAAAPRPNPPPSWAVPNWYVDYGNTSGCASDQNTCTSSTCSGTGVGPCKTFGEIWARWGAVPPVLLQATTITFVSPDNAEFYSFCPSYGPSGSLTFVGTTTVTISCGSGGGDSGLPPPDAAGFLESDGGAYYIGQPVFRVTDYGAKGDGTTDDTTAIQATVTAALEANGGVVWFPTPNMTYKVTAQINVPSISGTAGDPSNLVIASADGRQTTAGTWQTVTQYTYGIPIFFVTGSNVTIRDISGQYGPTTTLASPVSAGSSTIVVSSATGLANNDWLVLDQSYPLREIVQISTLSGTTVTLASATQYAHASGSWVRDQKLVSGTSIYADPPRNYAALAAFSFGNGCTLADSAAVAMVTGAYFRGNPVGNSTAYNTFNNSVIDFETDDTQYGILARQQSHYVVRGNRYEHATEAQTSAPGHAIYLTTQNSAGNGNTWSNSNTYPIYYQVVYSGHVYVSLVASNIGHQPDISPTFWADQGLSSNPNSYLNYCEDVVITDVFASPSASSKNWAGFTLKDVNRATVKGSVIVNADRSFNVQLCTDLNFTDFVFAEFVPPDAADTSAASLDILNCNRCAFSNGIVNLTQADGGPIDMPVVLNRVNTTGGITPSTVGINNSFTNIKAYTNYDSSFTQKAFRSVGTQNTVYDHIFISDDGGTNPPAFAWDEDTTDTIYSNGGHLILPTVIGTTALGETTTSTPTPPTYTLDTALIPTGYTISGPIGNLGKIPNGPIPYNIAGISPPGGTQFSCGQLVRLGSAQSGLSYVLPDATSCPGGAVLIQEENPGTGPYTYTFTDAAGHNINGSASYTIQTGTAYTQTLFVTDSSNWYVQPFPLYLDLNGNYIPNRTGSTVSTSATNGFVYLPSMSGLPTGTPTSYTGNLPIVYDTATQALWAYTSGLWTDVKALKVVTPASGGASLACGTFNKLGSGASGSTFTLPDATTCKGGLVEIQETNTAGPFTYNINTVSSQTITAQGTTATTDTITVAAGSNATVDYVSDGANWFRESPRFVVNLAGGANVVTGNLPITNIAPGPVGTLLATDGGTNYWSAVAVPYVQDSPANHGMVEWVENPDVAQATTTAANELTNLQLARIVAQTTATITKMGVIISSAGSGLTAATTTNVSGAANNGSGLIRLTVGATGSFSTNDVVSVAGITGTTEANSCWAITVIDGTHLDLQGSTFTNAYVSGGTVTRSANVGVVYSGAGALVQCTGDLSTTLTGTNAQTASFAATYTESAGNTYYVGLLVNGTTAPTLRSVAVGSASNFNLNGASLRWSTNGTGISKAPNTITPSSNSTTNLVTWWVGLL